LAVVFEGFFGARAVTFAVKALERWGRSDRGAVMAVKRRIA
jgi:hypothetical protein